METPNKVKKRYYWKVVTEDGLLKVPNKYGPYYDESKLNPYDGFDDEAQAVIALELFLNTTKHWHAGGQLTLVAIYE